jgi:hypothetical protein
MTVTQRSAGREGVEILIPPSDPGRRAVHRAFAPRPVGK